MPAYVLRRVYPTGFKEHVVIAAAEIQSSRWIDALKPDESPMQGNTRAGRMHTSWSDVIRPPLETRIIALAKNMWRCFEIQRKP